MQRMRAGGFIFLSVLCSTHETIKSSDKAFGCTQAEIWYLLDRQWFDVGYLAALH